MHSCIFDSWPKYLLHFLTNPPRSPFYWLLNQLFSYLVYLSKSESFQKDFLHKWLYQCFFLKSKSQRRLREQADHLLSLSSSGRLPSPCCLVAWSIQLSASNYKQKNNDNNVTFSKRESMIRGRDTVPFTHLCEENRIRPPSTIAKASKPPSGSHGLCVTLPHNITSPRNSSN